MIWLLPTWISWVILIRKRTKSPGPLSSSCPWTLFQGVVRGFSQNSKLPCNFELTRKRNCSLPPSYYALLWSRNAKTLKGWYNLSPWLDCTGMGFVAYQFCHLHRRVVVCKTAQSCKSHMWMIGKLRVSVLYLKTVCYKSKGNLCISIWNA